MPRTLTARLEALEREQREGTQARPGMGRSETTQGEWVYMPAWIRAQHGIEDPQSEAIDRKYGGLDQLQTVPVTFREE